MISKMHFCEFSKQLWSSHGEESCASPLQAWSLPRKARWGWPRSAGPHSATSWHRARLSFPVSSSALVNHVCEYFLQRITSGAEYVLKKHECQSYGLGVGLLWPPSNSRQEAQDGKRPGQEWSSDQDSELMISSSRQVCWHLEIPREENETQTGPSY